MKTTKLTIALISLVTLCVSAAWVAYKLTLHVGIVLSLFASTFVLVALLRALFRAPEGYEDADGFHVKAPDGQIERARGARLSQLARTLKVDMARLLSSP